MVRRLILILWALGSLAAGGAVPDWLWKLKHAEKRPPSRRNSVIAETYKQTDGEDTFKHKTLAIEIKRSLYETLTDAAKGDYEIVVASRKAIPKATGNAWGGATRGQWDSTVGVQYAAETAAVDVTEIANGRRYTVKGGTLEILHVPQIEFPNGETFTPEDGLTQHNIVLAAKPAPGTNSWAFKLDLPEGATLAYQPKLTPAEVARGNTRPEWVVGSYAIRAADRRKLGHIPRPYAVAADGKWTWGTWEWDAETATLTKVFPDAWLQAAVYPVTVDLTLGNSSAGGSGYFVVANYVYAFGPFTAPSSGVARGVHIRTARLGSNGSVGGALYSESGDDPNALVASSAVEGEITSGTYTWFSWTFASGTITAAAKYFPAAWWEKTSYISYDAGGSDDVHYDSETFDVSAWPATFANDAEDLGAGTFDIYVVYTESGGGAGIQRHVHHYRQQGVQ